MAATVAIGSPARAAVALDRSEPGELQQAESAPSRVHKFEFAGNAQEFFGIWTANILLSLVTLGIYSAWAKVRSKRYFYGNTRLDGFGFDYLARPTQILKGRLVVVLFFIAYAVVAELTPWADLVVGLVVMPALIPWAVVRALSFSRRYSSYRNVRFGFDGGKTEALGVYVLLPTAAAVSLGLLYPYSAYRLRRFQVEHSSFGRTPFAFDGAAAGYYRVYSIAFAFLLGVAALAAILGFAGSAVLSGAASMTTLSFKVVFGSVLAVGGLGLWVYVSTRLENYVWNLTRLGADRFRLDLELGTLYRIHLTNVAAIVLTLGLAIPWAKVRLARYRLSRLSLLAAGDLGRHVAQERGQLAAVGQELGDALDLDLGM